MLKIEKLNYSYKKGKQILHDIDLTVNRGEIVGLIGMNGAGKSTLMRNISGVVTPQSGRVLINGQDRSKFSDAQRRQVAFLNAENNLYKECSVKDNFNIFKHLYDSSDDVLNMTSRLLKCDDMMAKKIGELSSGMRQRAAIAASTLNEFRLFLLDEPTNAIDIETKRYIIEYIRYLSNENNGILITSHNIKDIQELCNRVYILRHGKIVKEATVDEILKESAEKNNRWCISVPAGTDVKCILENSEQYNCSIDTGDTFVKISVDESTKQKVIKELVDSDIDIVSVESMVNNLEDAVLEIIGD